ncbi:hypothetical protein ACOSP7_021532 [Xanthoceras sorbifolium]
MFIPRKVYAVMMLILRRMVLILLGPDLQQEDDSMNGKVSSLYGNVLVAKDQVLSHTQSVLHGPEAVLPYAAIRVVEDAHGLSLTCTNIPKDPESMGVRKKKSIWKRLVREGMIIDPGSIVVFKIGFLLEVSCGVCGSSPETSMHALWVVPLLNQFVVAMVY